MAAYSHRANPISDGAWLEFSEQLIRTDIDGHVRFEYECSDESGRQPHSIRETLEYTVSRAEDGSFVSSWLHVDEPSAPLPKESEMHVFEVRPRSDKRGFDLISGALPFGRRWYGEPNAISNAIGYTKFYSRSHDAVIRVYDEAGNVIETHEHIDDFKEPLVHFFSKLPRCFSALLSYSLLCSSG
jgi:hypothetical protein